MPTPLTIIIFGASGDLTARKLVPALYHLSGRGRLPDECRIVGAARSPLTDDQFRARLGEALRENFPREWDAKRWDEFAPRLFYVPTDAARPGGLDALQTWLHDHETGS